MNTKEHYLLALRQSAGRANEIGIGERIGLSEEETEIIIAQLLAEHRVEYVANGICQYKPVKK